MDLEVFRNSGGRVFLPSAGESGRCMECPYFWGESGCAFGHKRCRSGNFQRKLQRERKRKLRE